MNVSGDGQCVASTIEFTVWKHISNIYIKRLQEDIKRNTLCWPCQGGEQQLTTKVFVYINTGLLLNERIVLKIITLFIGFDGANKV